MKILDYNEQKNTLVSKRSKRSYLRQTEILKSLDVEVTKNPKETYDIIHLSSVGVATRRFLRKKSKRGIPIVYLANNNAENFKDTFLLANIASPFYQKFLISCYQLATRIVVPTEYAKAVLRSYGLEQPIDIIPNPVPVERYTYDPEKVAQFRDYFKLEPQQAVVVSSGFAYERKGILEFINVARAMRDVCFIWFGETETKGLPPKVKKALQDLPENVIMAGHIEGNIYEGALSAANVYFYPSYEDLEVQGVLEAMAASCQVVLRDIPVYRPWLIHNESCYMGDTNEDFISLIRGCLTDKLESTKQSGYKVAAKQSIDRSVELLKLTYEKALEEQ